MTWRLNPGELVLLFVCVYRGSHRRFVGFCDEKVEARRGKVEKSGARLRGEGSAAMRRAEREKRDSGERNELEHRGSQRGQREWPSRE